MEQLKINGMPIPFEPLWKQYNRVIKDNGVIALFADEPFSSTLIVSNMKMYRYELIWQKEGTDFLNANRNHWRGT